MSNLSKFLLQLLCKAIYWPHILLSCSYDEDIGEISKTCFQGEACFGDNSECIGPLIVEVYTRHNASFVIISNTELNKLRNKEPAVCRGQVSSVVAPWAAKQWVSGMIPNVCQDILG